MLIGYMIRFLASYNDYLTNINNSMYTHRCAVRFPRFVLCVPDAPCPHSFMDGEAAAQAQVPAAAAGPPVGPRVGLTHTAQPASSGRKSRPASTFVPVRNGEVWKQVTVVKDHQVNPRVECNHCSKEFCGGVSRIKLHITEQCQSSTETFFAAKEKLLNLIEADKSKKRQKTIERELDAETETVVGVNSSQGGSKKKAYSQQQITTSLSSGMSVVADNAMADFFYGCNIPPAVAGSPHFKKMVAAFKATPASYTTATSDRLLGDLLDSSTLRLKNDEQPMRDVFLKEGGTVISDGWDDIQSNHLVNLLVGTCRGMFFEGTVKLTSNDSEKAEDIAKIISDEIKSVGALNVVQVVTDTCTVMKAAWKLLEAEFPWITCTCCAPHVLSLYLKDLGRIPEVAGVISKVSKILNRFWGKTRWPRARLREVTCQNHGKELGLYRSKVCRRPRSISLEIIADQIMMPPHLMDARVERIQVTRFAGKAREMGRILRLKADLQRVVISADYAAHSFNTAVEDNADPEAPRRMVLGNNDPVKAIILDEHNFWAPLIDALKVMTPIVRLLRLTDGTAPAMGKILPRMEGIRQKIVSIDIPWKPRALEIHDSRWNYLQSPMHFAATCLDPEFLARELDEETQDGLIILTERLCLRSELKSLQAMGGPSGVRPGEALTTSSGVVQEKVAAAMLEISSYQEKEGIFSKPFVQKNAHSMAPSKWWATYGKALPLVSDIARTVLGQPACASAAGV